MLNRYINSIQERKPTFMESEADYSMDRKTEELVNRLNHELGERIKELNGLYGISKLVEKPGISLEEIFQGVVNLIPPSWQNPKVTCARICLDGKEYKTENFKESKWKQANDIFVHDERTGTLEVYYLEKKPNIHEGPFLKEESALIKVITERLGCIIERKQAKDELQEKTYDLSERVKELSCLYGISNLVDNENTSIEEILEGLVELIPPSWQYPEITCARIVLKGREFKTDNFKETIWKQSCKILVHARQQGIIEVCYLEKRKNSYDGPFLEEETNLLNAIAERTGRIIERTDARKSLGESEERYRVLTEHVTDGVAVIKAEKFVFMNRMGASMLGYDNVSLLTGKSAIDFISPDFRQDLKKSFNKIERRKTGKEIFKGKCIRRNGSEIWTEWHFNKITWEGNPCFMITVKDITEAKLRETTMQEETERLQIENKNLRTSSAERYKFGSIIGRAPGMQKVYNLISKAISSDTNVVIYGESGTGKELVARTIYDKSSDYKKSFVPVNCGAIPETIFESEFFGYRKGAFTGAENNKHGYFDLANKGMLFLDEIGELTLNMQVKLLRAIESGEFTPVGDNRVKRSETRIVAATNRNLIKMVNESSMREDFFYRIHVISIKIPPLRERKADIPLLVEHFIRSHGNGDKGQGIPGRIMDELCNHNWPGNVRELQNVIDRYLILGNLDFLERYGESPIENNHLPGRNQKREINDYNDTILSLEKNLISRALETSQWNKSKVAATLGIPRRTLYRKIEKFGLA